MRDSTSIVVVGPRDRRKTQQDEVLVNTTSHADNWERGLSPFFLGPCQLYGGHKAARMENGWQFAKVYPEHAGSEGWPTQAYWDWAMNGWRSDYAKRYPMGKGRKPLYLLWQGEKLGYVEGRLRVYWQLYRDAVKVTEAFARLKAMHEGGQRVVLFDFDGYDHDASGVQLGSVLLDDSRPMGHAFVLKSMLLFGVDVEAAEVLDARS